MKQCFLCGRWCNTEVHHLLFGMGLRKLSDQYHLTVDLCPECHRTGPRAVHNNAEVANALRAYGQKMWMEKTGGTVEDFIRVFGKNYLPGGDDNGKRDYPAGDDTCDVR